MIKKTLCIALFTFSLMLCGQTVFKLDSIHQYSWDDGMMDWRFDTRDLYTYDNGGDKETNLLRLNLNGVDWVNFYQFNKDYNGNNDLTQNIQQNWNAGLMDWQDSSRESYTYNGSNLLSVYEYAIWNGANWMIFADDQYAYDGLGNQIEDVRRDLDFTFMTLVNTYRSTNNYSGGLQQYNIYEEWRDFLNDWENVEKTDFSYDGNNNMILSEVRAWQTMSMDWSDPYKRSQLSYNLSNQVTESIEQTFGSGMWNNTTRALFSYTDGNLTELLAQEWNSGLTAWENGTRQLRTFDTDDNEIELIYESWDDIGSVWEGFLRLVKYWSPVETLGVSIEDSWASTKAYPNPVSSVLTISFNEPLEESTEVEIYSINGALISRILLNAGVNEQSVQMSYLNSGTYLLKLTSSKRNGILKVVKK
ncbi:MAG: T9SS type A sorting domain-containing protein [Flavobacteriaceae bacterium]|nr:T9SS type A sorting domain-containing protein [Flavobacteriaceae bacterium]